MPTPRKPPATHKKPGTKPWTPSDSDREKCKRFLEARYKLRMIAAYFEKDVDTIEKAFAEEIRTARMELMRHGISKYQMAVLKGEEWALKMLLSNQARGKDFEEGGWGTQVAGPGGGDLFKGLDLSRLSDGQYAQLKDILATAGVAISDPAGGSAPSEAGG